jgi:hypothetical protein
MWGGVLCSEIAVGFEDVKRDEDATFLGGLIRGR